MSLLISMISVAVYISSPCFPARRHSKGFRAVARTGPNIENAPDLKNWFQSEIETSHRIIYPLAPCGRNFSSQKNEKKMSSTSLPCSSFIYIILPADRQRKCFSYFRLRWNELRYKIKMRNNFKVIRYRLSALLKWNCLVIGRIYELFHCFYQNEILQFISVVFAPNIKNKSEDWINNFVTDFKITARINLDK